MARTKRPRNLDDLVVLVSDLIDQIKVLVSAVDDLRCEVEWWARNAVDQRDSQPSPASCYVQHNSMRSCLPEADDESAHSNGLVDCAEGVATTSTAEQGAERSPVDSPELTAKMRLAQLERSLAAGRRDEWPDEWDGNDAPELPAGKVIRVDDDLWEAVLDVRPAHVVGRGCCCEEGIGAPYLLAWQNEEGSFLLELSDKEAYQLQRACLDAQAEEEGRQNAQQSSETQMGLW